MGSMIEIVWSNFGFKPILITAVTEIDEVLVKINKDSQGRTET